MPKRKNGDKNKQSFCVASLKHGLIQSTEDAQRELLDVNLPNRMPLIWSVFGREGPGQSLLFECKHRKGETDKRARGKKAKTSLGVENKTCSQRSQERRGSGQPWRSKPCLKNVFLLCFYLPWCMCVCTYMLDSAG